MKQLLKKLQIYINIVLNLFACMHNFSKINQDKFISLIIFVFILDEYVEPLKLINSLPIFALKSFANYDLLQ